MNRDSLRWILLMFIIAAYGIGGLLITSEWGHSLQSQLDQIQAALATPSPR